MLASPRRRPSAHAARSGFAAAPAPCELLETRALLSAVTISAANNDADGRQTVVLPDDARTVTVLADGAYAFLKIDADGVLSNVAVTLAAGLTVTGELWVESDGNGTGAVSVARAGGGAIDLDGELRFRGNGGGGAGPGDSLGDLNVGGATLVFNGDATVGRVTADKLFVETKGSGESTLGAVVVAGADLTDFAAEDDSRLNLSDVTAAGDLRVRALDRSAITAGDLVAGDGATADLLSAEVTSFTAGDVTTGAAGVVNLGATEGGQLTVGDVTTGDRDGAAGPRGGVAVRAAFAAVVRADEITTGGDVGVAGIESGGVILGDVNAAGGTVAVGLTDFAAVQLGVVAAQNLAIDANLGPVSLGAPAVSGNVAIQADADVQVRGTGGDDVLNMRRWEVFVAGTFVVQTFGGDDFIRLGAFELGSLEIFTGTGTDVVRTDGLTVSGRAGVLFEGTGTLAAWRGSAGSWFVIAGSGNTRATFALGEVAGNVSLTGGRGRDALVFTGQDVGGRIAADTGAGRDTVVLRNGSTAGDIRATTGADTDSLSLVDARVAGDVRFDSGDAADRISVARARLGGSLFVDSGGGNDQVRVIDARTGRIDVRSGDGRDRVRVQQSRVTDRLFVDLDDDNDRLDLDRRTARARVVRLRGGEGRDRLVDGPEKKSRGFEKFVNRA